MAVLNRPLRVGSEFLPFRQRKIVGQFRAAHPTKLMRVRIVVAAGLAEGERTLFGFRSSGIFLGIRKLLGRGKRRVSQGQKSYQGQIPGQGNRRKAFKTVLMIALRGQEVVNPKSFEIRMKALRLFNCKLYGKLVGIDRAAPRVAQQIFP